ncbi:MYXO-CTERM sorting domain-containing protein [Pseudenhygromyxa sp. WMMC2535]|uniref:MYXO-CTERM sorting domain-containing protein n=1 Tax=Pseudenhygromyxa sp. WMMC2535 TaxID=2712867 RepID=UPI001557D0BE|nr:MYXO-CTERM sorting domain-containing protein [Pseudenhygromyxa sp. WMMC2535]NVB39540.1 MYXO-CTERM sorting domain-containing protein [Pseudenhygromyxa sp. WMMC2535]
MIARRALGICLGLLTCGLASLAPTPALAEGPEESDDFSPFLELLLLGFDDASLDTGWIPQGSPVQMRFYASASNSVVMSLPGDAIYDWEEETLRFEGSPLAGVFEYDVGLELQASVKVDVSVVQWESDLLGPYDWGVDELVEFTPYLLPGNPDRPASIVQQSDAFPLASVPLIPDIVILSGNLDIDLFVDIDAQFECERIEVLDPGGEIVSFTNEDEILPVDPGEGEDDLVLPATAYCRLRTAPTLIINPHLVMEVAFQEYDIAGIDIPIDLPVVDDEIAFDTIELTFPRWEAPEPEDTGDTGESGGESGEDGGSADEVGDEVGDTGDTGGDDLGGEYLDDGCNCSSTDAAPERGLGWALGLFGLVALRRRRRR